MLSSSPCSYDEECSSGPSRGRVRRGDEQCTADIQRASGRKQKEHAARAPSGKRCRVFFSLGTISEVYVTVGCARIKLHRHWQPRWHTYSKSWLPITNLCRKLRGRDFITYVHTYIYTYIYICIYNAYTHYNIRELPTSSSASVRRERRPPPRARWRAPQKRRSSRRRSCAPSSRRSRPPSRTPPSRRRPGSS